MPKRYRRTRKRPTLASKKRKAATTIQRAWRARQSRKSYRKSLTTSRLSPFPNSKLVFHDYVANITIPVAAAAGTGQLYTFRANGMFDPDYTGTGHQPLYRDEMAAKYKYYTVLKATCMASFDPADTGTCNFMVLCTTDLTPEKVYAETALEEYQYTVPQRPSYHSSTIVRRAFCDVAKIWKTTKKGILADDTFRTPAGSDPAGSIIYFHILAFPLDPTTTLSARLCQVRIRYLALWREVDSIVGS